jgi:hypothetical protein
MCSLPHVCAHTTRDESAARTCRVHQIAGHDSLSSKGSPAHTQISSGLSSPQQGQVVGSTIRSTVRGAVFDIDLMFAHAHHAAREYSAKSRAGTMPAVHRATGLSPPRQAPASEEERESLFRSGRTDEPTRRPGAHPFPQRLIVRTPNPWPQP